MEVFRRLENVNIIKPIFEGYHQVDFCHNLNAGPSIENIMGCTASQPTCRVENRPKELDKCAALSSDVRWAWLRGRTLFTFVELRTLLKLYQVATATSDDIAVVGSYEQQSDRELAGPFTAAPSFTTTEGDESLSGRDSIVGTMSKEQFLAACQRDETFRLSEVVGTFGPRLFDVLDKDGDGKLDFEDFIVGMSKLLKVCTKKGFNLDMKIEISPVVT